MNHSITLRSVSAAAAAASLLFALPVRAETWGLLVGVSKYHNSQISSLTFPAADATALSDALAKLGRIPKEHILTLTDDDATGDKIKAGVTDFLGSHVKPGDDVIVSLAGHGVCKGIGLDARSYFLPSDVRGLSTAAMDLSGINVRDLANTLSKLPAKQFIILVDACREDPTPGRGLKGNQLSDKMSSDFQIVPRNSAGATASATFFACQIGERAYEDPTFKHGVFTYYVLKAIQKAVDEGQKNGELQMPVLAEYVKDLVTQWTKTKNADGADIEQQPQLQCLGETPKVVLMKVKPSDALLSPGSAGVVYGEALKGVETRSAGGPAADQFRKAQLAERNDQWEVAEQGYSVVIETDPKFGPAYDRLAWIQGRRGRYDKAVSTLLKRNEAIPPDAHAYSTLAQTYAAIARDARAEAESKPQKEDQPGKEKGISIGGVKIPFGGGRKKKKPEDEPPPAAAAEAGEFRVTQNGSEAAALAQKAAKLAQDSDAKSSEAKQAMGFALIAGDGKGANRDEALAIFGRAVFLDENDAAAHYGLGYALRYYSKFDKEDAQQATLKRAADSLKKAIELRPNYYEAHRELAFCYHVMGDRPQAKKEYETANANRASATDPNDVAGVNVSLSALYREDANHASGDRKRALMDASTGYLDEAKEISPDIKAILNNLIYRGVGGAVRGGLDATWGRAYNDVFSGVPGPLRGPLGGLIHL